jgi:hypothetical protein
MRSPLDGVRIIEVAMLVPDDAEMRPADPDASERLEAKGASGALASTA